MQLSSLFQHTALVGLLLVASSGRAQSGVRLAPEPPRFRSIGMAFDPATDRLVTACSSEDFLSSPGTLHARVGTTWRAIGPTPIRLATMISDPVRRQLVGLAPNRRNAYQLDTHLWDGTSWTLAASLTFRSLVPDHPAAAFHPGTGLVVLHVGVETYTWDGSAWTPVPTASAPAGAGTMVTDTARDRCVWLKNDTWEWDGTQWQQTVPISAVHPTGQPVFMAYDPLLQCTIAFGGFTGQGVTDLTWAYDGTAWSPQPAATRPEPRHRAAIGFDPKRGRVVMHGGQGQLVGPWRLQHQSEWEWTGSDWVRVCGAPQAGLGFVMFSDPARPRPLMTQVGTVTGNEHTFEWTGSGWRALATNQPGPTQEVPLPYFDSSHGMTKAYATNRQEMWQWTGGEWSVVAAPLGPRPRTGAALAYDPLRNTVVLFGGQDYSNIADTWEWNGSAWLERFPVVSPPARRGHAMAFDPISQTVIMFGGDAVGDTWSWDGVDWALLTQTTSPPPRSYPVLTSGPDGRLILLGGNQSGPQRDVYAFDGRHWSLAGTMPPDFDGERGPIGLAMNGALLVQDRESTWAWTNTPTLVQEYGSDCGAPAPRLAAAGRPTLDAPGFAMVVDHLTSSSLAVLLLSPLPTSSPLAGCELLVDQPVTFGLLPANPFGVAPFSVPIPATAGLAGLAVYWQAFALDSNGVAASRGLQTTLGY